MNRHSIAILAGCVIFICSINVHGLTINMTDIGSSPMSAVQLAAFNQAAGFWESAFTDPITVNINIAFDNLDPGILGSTSTQRTTHPYTTVRAAMIADAFAGTEFNAVSLLPGGSTLPINDINGSRNDNQITLATANAKALGLGTTPDSTYGISLGAGVDARIKFANAFASSFDYDRTDGISGALKDFTGVATHEIGHALGFFSLTDVQDGNSTYTLHPNTLDMWRFNDTGGSHTIGSESRRVINGAAEYYDSVFNNLEFSRGVMQADAACNTFSGSCQASHWRDNAPEDLMDPTLADGVLQNMANNDKHGIDYIGYDKRRWLLRIPRRWLIGWYLPFPGPLPEFSGIFDEFNEPPDPDSVQAPFVSDLAMRIGLDFDVVGMQMRSGVGFALFEEETDNPNAVPLSPLQLGKDEVNQFPGPFDPPDVLPQALMDFYFKSDEKGTPFEFRAVFGEGGAQFDPSLGQFGGYLVSGVLDGMGDNKQGDVDGTMSITLLATTPGGMPDPNKQNTFELLINGGEHGLQIYDATALGTCINGDINCDGVVGLIDLDILGANFNQSPRTRFEGDLSGDTKVGLLDLDQLGQFWGDTAPTVPEPATLTMLLSALVLVTGRKK